jgi:hypothetical protein
MASLNGAAALACAIAQRDTFVTGASFDDVQATGGSHATADSALAGFPTTGRTYAVLTTDNAEPALLLQIDLTDENA